VKDQLKNLDGISDDALEWLMLEHFQFSFSNPGFLATAATTTERLADEGVAIELQRNCNEEDGHAEIYKKGLSEIGTDTDKHVEFTPTTEFLGKIENLATAGPSHALGAIYATETAAIFEHEIFWDISHEVCKRRGIEWESTIIKGFHDMHLSGVEQSHKDELGVFLEPSGEGGDRAGEPTKAAEILDGAGQAIDAMTIWWRALVDRVRTA
jgi:hypothetical protein